MRQAIEAIYSEKFDFDVVLNTLASKSDRLHALIAIKFSVSRDEPINGKIVRQALDEIISTQGDLENAGKMRAFLDLLQESTEIDFLERVKTILEGKLAFQQDEYSYEGSLYKFESVKKGPASKSEKEKWRAISRDIKEAEAKYNECLIKLDEAHEEASKQAAQAVLDQMIQERDARRKNMSEKEIQNEIDEARQEREEAIRQIKEIARSSKEK